MVLRTEINRFRSGRRRTNLLFFLCAALLTMLMSMGSSTARAQAFLDIESGAVLPGYNNVRIPGNTGTEFSLTKDLSASTEAFIRIRAGYTIKQRHTISLLFAPLTVNSKGSAGKQIIFQGVTFPSDTHLNAKYKFNSYRITYRYDFVRKEKFELGFGLTAKVRDAEIALSSQEASASKTNVGFVPLINFRLNWKFQERFALLLDGDALAAPQGRAEDVLIAGTYKSSERLMFRLGYRILEGGADNDEVYNFALFNYISAGVSYTF